MKISVINGPNINMLGVREPEIYGSTSYEDLLKSLSEFGKMEEIELDFFQSNGEKEIIDYIQNAYKKVDGFVINPAAYTHYSIAILDAIKSVPKPFIEIHISNIFSREDFRQKSIMSSACIGTIMGFGLVGYEIGILSMKKYLQGGEGFGSI